MSRVHFTFLLIAIAVPNVSLRAEEPAKKFESNVSGGATVTIHGLTAGGTNVGQGTFNTFAPAASNSSASITGGTLQLGNGSLILTPAGGPLVPSPGPTFAPVPGSIIDGGSIDVLGINATPIVATATSTACQPGKTFYIIAEGAGIGDNVRRFPCSGKETVLDAISQVNGLSQISSTKIWIARPAPTNLDKSTILDIDWEAISKRGINTTNYTLMPGDRLVIGEDPLIKRTNLIGKKTAMIERLDGVLGLTTSTLRGLHGASAADYAILKELVNKGAFTDDEEMKGMLQETIHLCEVEREKARSKEVEKSKPGR